MSGRGSDGFGGGGGGDIILDGEDTCDRGYADVPLSSPKQQILSTLQVGDPLQIGIQSIRETPVLVATKNGEIVGSLANFVGVMKVIKCIQQGHQYVATVKQIDGGRCVVDLFLVR